MTNLAPLPRKLALSLAVIALAAACGGSDSSSETTTSSPATIHVRVAHLSPDAPAVDFCAKEGSGAFSGPVLASLGAQDGLAYPQVTKYLDLPAGQYTVRLVAPGATSCDASLAGLPDYTLPALGDGTFATVAAVGLVGGGTPAFTVKPFVDGHAPSAGNAALRFVHASPGTPPVDVGAGSGASFTALFTNVAFGDFAAGAGIDARGYVETSPLSNATLSARATGTTTDALVVPGVSLAAGQTVTAYAIGLLGSTPTPLRVLVCPDAAAASGLLSDCAAVP